jgi:muramoyltetrapeptide carboxypeptidase
MGIELSRKEFLGILGTLPFFTSGIYGAHNYSSLQKNNICRDSINAVPTASDYNINSELQPTIEIHHKAKCIAPPPLKKGDSIAFTAPASPISRGKISAYIKYFQEKGCEIVIGDTIIKQNNGHRYFSGTDEFRAEEFNKFICDEKIRAIICGRGGYGCMRILRLLDYETLKKSPKFIMGYSDITALLLAIYRQSSITTYHGPVASSKLTTEHKQNLEQVFFLEQPTIEYKATAMKFMFHHNKDTLIQGKLQGGNLTLIEASLGTPYSIDLTDSLFFMEDTSVLAHDIDRMLASLLNAGQLEKCKAILVGKMKKFEHRGNFFPNRAFTIKEVIEQYAKKVNVPIIYNLSFGHIESQYIFPLGIEAEIDVNSKMIRILKKN